MANEKIAIETLSNTINRHFYSKFIITAWHSVCYFARNVVMTRLKVWQGCGLFIPPIKRSCHILPYHWQI